MRTMEGSTTIYSSSSRFKKDEVKQLLDVPTAFAIDKRNGYPNAVTETPAEALLVFLWRSAHPSALAHLISNFGKSRPWISRVRNRVLDHIHQSWGE